ncbi:MAG: hypothetical protein CUN55_10695 [Phototrophicales bacterium]|nr:MAG: hypothetical protein CUN55_10695 [Phototrophicales bacterium]
MYNTRNKSKIKDSASLEPQVQHIDGHRAQITVTVDDDIKEKSMREAAKKLASKVRIPGFRPGKAPYEVVLRHVGEENLLNEALEDIVNEVYRQVLDAVDIEPFSAGSVTDIKNEERLVITFEIPKQPIVDLGDYRSLRLPFEEPVATDEQVEKSLARLREQLGVSATVEREAQYNDIVVLDVHAYFVDEESADAEASDENEEHDHENDERERFMHEHGLEYLLLEDESRDLAPGFSAALLGVKAGDERKFTLTFTDDEEEEDLRGRSVEFNVTVREVKEVILPEVDDFMAQIASDGEIKTLEALRERIRENLQTELENRANNQYANQIIEQLVSQSSFIYPEEIVEEYIDDVIKEIDDYLRQQAGFGVEDYVNLTNTSMEELRAQNRERAIERMKNTLALSKLAEVERIQVSPEAVEEEIDRQIMSFGSGQPHLLEALRPMFQSPETRNRIVSQLLYDKTIERIVEIAKGIAPELTAEDEGTSEATQEEATTEADATSEETKEEA